MLTGSARAFLYDGKRPRGFWPDGAVSNWGKAPKTEDSAAVQVNPAIVPSFGKLAHLAVLLLAGTVLAGCAGLDLSDSGRNPDTPYGNYLAGRHASVTRDLDAASDYLGRTLAEDPANAVVLERAFIVALANGDMDKAAELGRQSIENGGDERTARLVLALQALKEGRYEEADAQIEQSAPGPFTALIGTLTRAWAAAGEGDKDGAVKLLDTFKGRTAFEIFRTYHMALILDYMEDPGAGAAYEEAMTAAGGASLRVVEAYGRHLERTGKSPEAAQLYRDYEALSPGHPLMEANLKRIEDGEKPDSLIEQPADGAAEALYGLGSALAQEAGLDIAALYLRLAVYLNPDFDVARTLLADIYERAEDWKSAIAAHKGVSEDSPLRPNADIQIAVNYNRLDETEKAVTLLRGLQEEQPNNVEPIVALGDLYRMHERFPEAAREYSRAIALIGDIGPDNWSLLYARGVCYERMKRWPDAEKELKKALVLSEEHPLVLNYLGYSWVDQKINLAKAMEMIRKAVDERPQDGFIVDSLGWAYYRLGQYEEAVKHLERAVELQPDDPVINDHLGDALWKVGRKIEARFQWRHALEMKPADDAVPEIEAKLDYGLDEAVQRGEAEISGPAGTPDKGV